MILFGKKFGEFRMKLEVWRKITWKLLITKDCHVQRQKEEFITGKLVINGSNKMKRVIMINKIHRKLLLFGFLDGKIEFLNL